MVIRNYKFYIDLLLGPINIKPPDNIKEYAKIANLEALVIFPVGFVTPLSKE